MKNGRLKKIAFSFLTAALAVTAASTAFSKDVFAKAKEEVTVSRVVTGENGKSYVEVDGKPFMYENVECMGTWLLKGFDASTIKGFKDPLPVSWLENVFDKTSQAGYNTVSTFFCWSDIEPEKEGVYDWTLLDQYLEWADKYNVRLSLTWFGSDAGGGTRLPGYGAGWSCHVPAYLCDQQKYWNRRAVPSDAYSHETRFRAIPGTTEGNYIKECEKKALIALTEHLRDYDKTHRVISLMINNESQNIPDSWHTELANAVKSVGYHFVIGQHMQKGQYKAREGYDFVGFDDYSTNLEYKLSFLNNSPTALKACLETGGNANNLSSQVLSGITNGGWVQAWQLCDAYSDCNQLGMFETPDGVYPKFTNKVSEQAGQEYDTISKPDYLTWEVGTKETLKYGAQKNRRLQIALRKAYWVVAQASEKEMLSFNLETDEPVANYSADKKLNGHTFGFISDGPDSVRGKGSNGMIAGKGNEYFCLSDTGTAVTFTTDVKPTSATYGHQDGYLEEEEEGTGEWVAEGEAKVEEVVAEDGTKTWSVTCEPEQVIRLELEENNAAPVFEKESYEKITMKNTVVSGDATATDENYGDTVSYSLEKEPSNGTADVNEKTGKWTYTPNTDFVGEENFTIAAEDNHKAKGYMEIKIIVREKSSTPVFKEDTIQVTLGKNSITGGKCEATDEDEGDTQTYSIQKAPAHGNLITTANGYWTYTALKDYTGEDQFIIRVTDSYGDTADMTANVSVTETEQAGSNLTLKEGVTVEATSSFRTNPAGNAIDGNTNTLWSPNGNKLPQSLTVDLGGIHKLNAVKYQVAATTSFEWRYKIEGSKDSVSWEVLVDRENAGSKPAGNTQVTEAISGEYRYVRWTVTGTTSNRDTVSTREFEIWGDEEVISADAHEPIITKQPVSAEYAYGDTPENLLVDAQTDDGGLISYQWYKNTTASYDGASLISGATDALYTPKLEEIGDCYYYCRVTNRNDNTAGVAEVSTDSEIVKITVNKAEGKATVTISGWIYGETASEPQASTETNDVNQVSYWYKVKDADDSTYSEEVPTEVGNYTLKAVFAETEFYKEVSVTSDFSITEAPIEEKTLDRIEITAPLKTEYEYGEELDLTGFKVTAVYSDESVEDVTAEATLSEYDANKSGEQVLTVTYKDKSGEITVFVKEEPVEIVLERIEVTAPSRTEYEYGEELDLTGFKVTAVYSDESEKDVTKTATLSGFDANKSGEQILTVEFEGKTAEFKVVVKEKVEEIKTGWQEIDGQKYYYGEDGTAKTYWQQIDGKWYFFGNDGAMRTYWQKIWGKWYYLGNANDGAMKTGWQQIWGKWYYLGSANDGAMKTGWQKVYGKWYYLGNASDGVMKTYWQQINGKWYFFGSNNDGAMKTGWQKIWGKWYYLGGADDGAMKTNKWIGKYYVNNAGVWTKTKNK